MSAIHLKGNKKGPYEVDATTKRKKEKESNLERTLAPLQAPGADQPFDAVCMVLRGHQSRVSL
jgi:hypothetical protein